MNKCPNCDREFSRKCNLNRHVNSKICISKPCEACGTLTINPKFCSSKCAGTTSKGRTQTKETRIKISKSLGGIGELYDFINSPCLNCGKIIKSKFCNQSCYSEYNKTILIEKWLSGEETGTTKQGGPTYYVKRYLIEKYGEKCMECGWAERNPHSGNIPIELEHIDGIRSNNRPENLKLLCPNCHSLTSTYKGMNQGNGNPHIRKIMREQYRRDTKEFQNGKDISN